MGLAWAGKVVNLDAPAPSPAGHCCLPAGWASPGAAPSCHAKNKRCHDKHTLTSNVVPPSPPFLVHATGRGGRRPPLARAIVATRRGPAGLHLTCTWLSMGVPAGTGILADGYTNIDCRVWACGPTTALAASKVRARRLAGINLSAVIAVTSPLHFPLSGLPST